MDRYSLAFYPGQTYQFVCGNEYHLKSSDVSINIHAKVDCLQYMHDCVTSMLKGIFWFQKCIFKLVLFRIQNNL